MLRAVVPDGGPESEPPSVLSIVGADALRQVLTHIFGGGIVSKPTGWVVGPPSCSQPVVRWTDISDTCIVIADVAP